MDFGDSLPSSQKPLNLLNPAHYLAPSYSTIILILSFLLHLDTKNGLYNNIVYVFINIPYSYHNLLESVKLIGFFDK